jgi:hypothetical protein
MTTTTPGTEAYHEAAHAVVAHHFGHRITKADQTAIEVEIETVDGMTPAGKFAHETIVVSLAGGYAAKRFNGNGATGGYADNAYAKYLALRLSEGRQNEAGALLAWLRCRAVTIVDRNWRAIQAVAEALTERSTLTEAEIHKIIGGREGDIAE